MFYNIHKHTILMILTYFFTFIGRTTIKSIKNIGKLAYFFISIIFSIFSLPIHFWGILQQIVSIGLFSIPIVALTSIFTGAVLSLQSYSGFARFSATDSIPTIVALSIIRELGPVLTSFIITGKVGAAIAAEISSMRVNEQIDALYSLGTDPIKYLIVPRMIAIIITVPCLVLISDFIGIFGGYLVAVYKLNFNNAHYIADTIKHLKIADITLGLVKAVTFAVVIGTISCFYGYYCTGGAKDVGKNTTTAVVISSILILFTNYILTSILFSD